MRVNLTPGFVAKAEPPKKGDRVIYWDLAMSGLGLMVTARGHRRFVVQYRSNRRLRRMRLKDGLSLAGARREAKAIIGEAAKGGDPLEHKRKAAAAANAQGSIAMDVFDQALYALLQWPVSGFLRGESFLEHLYAEPERLRGFLSAMTKLSAGAAQAIAAKFAWRDYKTFMDLGAARGIVPVTLARAHSHLSGIGFDLPPVQPVFEEFVANHGLSSRVRFQAGNFLEDPLPKVDVIIMGHILHNWDLTDKKKLLNKAFQALSKRGAIIVYDAIIDNSENAFALLTSLNMLVETYGGFDYTGADCQKWMREAGFSETRVEPLVGPESMLVGLK
jgi:precorrin-6B methylase 2